GGGAAGEMDYSGIVALQPARCPGMWTTMYFPDHFAESRLEVLHQLVRDHPFAVLVTPSADGIDANHLPMQIDARAGRYGTLLGHVARTNPVWRTARGAEALPIFAGPHGYEAPGREPSNADS